MNVRMQKAKLVCLETGAVIELNKEIVMFCLLHLTDFSTDFCFLVSYRTSSKL